MVAVLVLAAVAGAAWVSMRGTALQAAAAAPGWSAPGSEAAVPGGALMLLDGRPATLAGLRGEPVLVWFVAAGCASCAVSIPAVGSQLAAFQAARTRVLVLGLYGAFGTGGSGAGQLASFGKATAGVVFGSRAWTWGLASEQLTAAFDPSGTPDAYFLLDAAGRVVYQNSVPVSTMSDLLGHLKAAG